MSRLSSDVTGGSRPKVALVTVPGYVLPSQKLVMYGSAAS